MLASLAASLAHYSCFALSRSVIKVLNQIIGILKNSNVIDEKGVAVLTRLGQSNSPILLAAFDAFHRDNNLSGLLETLSILSKEYGDAYGYGEEDSSSSEDENDKVQPMTSVERRRSLSLEESAGLTASSGAAAFASQSGGVEPNGTGKYFPDRKPKLLCFISLLSILLS